MQRSADVVVRPVRDLAELADAFDVAGAAQDPPMDHTDWRFDAVRDGFPGGRDVDLVAERDGALAGAALSFRDGGGVRVRLLGVRSDLRNAGLGARLMAGVEAAAWRAGDGRVYLGAVPTAAGFYRRIGYSLAGRVSGNTTVFEKTPLSKLRLDVVPDAPWLPPGSDAESYRWESPTPPEPVCLVRLVLRRGDELFLVDGPESLDLPRERVADIPAAEEWRLALESLTARVLGAPDRADCLGFVRNVVPEAPPSYPFPSPHAHFAVFESAGTPVVPGTWLTLAQAERHCSRRHWWPVVSAGSR